ncbi:SAM-dependent DNA methyltransferase, partial [candidate division WWE3 bacterium]|nr:SAM-dependent DNA methyltransferase [candidate division WWE3 bacterium]
MLTGELKSKIDRVWDAMAAGGVANQLTVIEQITYLLFIKRLDEIHTLREKKSVRFDKEIENPIFSDDQDDLRWSRFRDMDPEKMYEIINLKVFPFIKNLKADDTTYASFMKDATFMIPTPNLLQKVVDMLNDLDMKDTDTKGDLYEYLLSRLMQAGRAGSFRTPRHIIRMMVEIVNPTPEDTICDPACGTAGFLVSSSEYLRETYPEILHDEKLRNHFNNEMFFGMDFDATMIRISAMNMLLHGIENPNIQRVDSLSEQSLESTNKKIVNRGQYSLILANPPFKGSLDYDTVANDLLKIVKTKKTELLFLALIVKLLKVGGRSACIVPDGVLFGSSNAHKSVRKMLVDEQKLQAVISMPSGVFKPYAGVSTAILVFTKTDSGGTDKVWFYDMQADGFSLD